ncbi:MAG: hypothetical protein PHQ05_06280 [Sterolibacterium sp.]|nr:hypothetical protein [Sterolibacterium sp.]
MISTADQQRRRSLLYALSGVGLLGSISESSVIRTVLAADNSIAAQGIRRLSGNLVINGTAGHEGMLVRPGDTLVTGAASAVVYVIGQDAFMQRAQTTVSLGDSAAQGVLRVVSGKLLSVFGKGGKNIVTPTATIGIRGSGCYIEVEAKRVYFCLCYGEADLVPTSAPAERKLIRASHHDHPLYIHIRHENAENDGAG